MTKGTKTVIYVALLAGAGYFAYTQFFMGKSKKAQYLQKMGYASNATIIVTFEDGFVNAWYKAAKKNAVTFIYNGSVYNTKGGKKAV